MRTELQELVIKLEQIASHVYYAKSFRPSRDVDVQLDRILEILEVRSPKDVGLSANVLDDKDSQDWWNNVREANDLDFDIIGGER